VFTALAVRPRRPLHPGLGDNLPLSTLFGSVARAVWVGGCRPALPAVVLGFLACEGLLLGPRGTLGLDNTRHLIGLWPTSPAVAS
jgi:hypothetical protein